MKDYRENVLIVLLFLGLLFFDTSKADQAALKAPLVLISSKIKFVESKEGTTLVWVASVKNSGKFKVGIEVERIPPTADLPQLSYPSFGCWIVGDLGMWKSTKKAGSFLPGKEIEIRPGGVFSFECPIVFLRSELPTSERYLRSFRTDGIRVELLGRRYDKIDEPLLRDLLKVDKVSAPLPATQKP